MKKTLAIILAILMIVTTIPMVALPASAALTPTATGGCNGNHSGYTQIKLNGGTTHRITKAGNYYINSSIYESTYSPALEIECSGTVTICLNGYDICHTGYGSRVVYIRANGGELTVNLCDCKGTGEIYHEKGDTGIDFAPGVITLNMYGGTIRDCNSGLSTWSNSTVNMYGGTIKNCSYYGIYQDSNNGKVNIYGGSIINNNEGIRVCSADSVTLTGSPVISGNTNGDLYYRRPNSAVVAKDLSVSSPITIGQDREAAGDYAVVKVDSADMLGSFKYINNTKQLFYNNNQIFVHGDSHSFKDATCAAPKTCTICGATEGVADNTAHATWGEGVLTRPTKTEEGYYTYTCSACGATKTEAAQRAANYAEYTKALNDLRAYLDSDKLTDDVKASVAEWLEIYDSDEAYKFIAGEEETVNLYIEAALYYATEIEAAIQDCLAGNHSGNGEYCDICGAALHICDFTGEWKYDSEKHWKECTCGETSEETEHTYTDSKCDCGYECPHEKYIDGVCDVCGYECAHKWVDGYCKKCKTFCNHEINENGVCTVCDYVLAFAVITGDTVSYYDRFDDALENAEDGSTVKLMKELYKIASYEINKSITFDLNGNNWETGSSDHIDVNAFVTFTDSVGTGRLNLSLNLYSPCIFNSGTYKGIGIVFETEDTIDDYLAECHGIFDHYTGEFKDVSDEKFVMGAKVDVNHNLGAQTCKGYQCEDCGNYFGEADPDAHDWSNTDGICVICGAACSHEWGESVLVRPTRTEEGYSLYTCSICNDTKTEPVERPANYAEFKELLEKVKGYLDENLTDSMLQEVNNVINFFELDANHHFIKGEENIVSQITGQLDEFIEVVEKGIEDGSAVKVNGMAIMGKMIAEWGKKIEADGLMDDYEEFVHNEKATEEALAEENAIREFAWSLEGSVAENADNIEQLEGMVNKLLVDFENCLNGTHNVRQYNEIETAKCGENALEEGTCWFCAEVLTREVEDTALTHSFTKYEVTEEAKCGVAGKEVAYCDNGCGETDEKAIEALTHSFTKYEVTEEAKCGIAGKEVAYCDNGCGETAEKAIEALTHSFTKYEVTEEAKCVVAGKEVAYCDNGCGEADEKAIEALEHIFLDYIYNEDASCEADGTKTAVCLNGCGETDTVTAEDTMLDHADEDGDDICDDCESEIKDVCPDCGGSAHSKTGLPQYICMIITFMKLIFSLVRVLQAIA